MLYEINQMQNKCRGREPWPSAIGARSDPDQRVLHSTGRPRGGQARLLGSCDDGAGGGTGRKALGTGAGAARVRRGRRGGGKKDVLGAASRATGAAGKGSGAMRGRGRGGAG